MIDTASMPLWVWIMVGAASVVLVALLILWFVVGRKVMVRRYLVSLVGRREGIRAARRTLEAVIRHLVDESDEALAEFAQDPLSADRKALQEVAAQMRMAADDLDVRALPDRLVRVAEELADAAYVISREASKVGDEPDADAVLVALASVDLGAVAAQVEEADRWVDDACDEYGVEDASVYGGGLYI